MYKIRCQDNGQTELSISVFTLYAEEAARRHRRRTHQMYTIFSVGATCQIVFRNQSFHFDATDEFFCAEATIPFGPTIERR